MKIPIVKYNDKFLDRISWIMKVGGITIWPWIVIRERYRDNPRFDSRAKITINHETIHIKQQQEMLVLPFFIWYFVEWFLKSIIYMSFNKGYLNISFEREAYSHQTNHLYLKTRKWYSWMKYIFK